MAKTTFSSSWGKVKAVTKSPAAAGQKTAEDIVRDMKNAGKAQGEDYRERSLTIHGLICARCAREFSGVSRQLLTVHHKDGNHHNNPQDGSNWENLCVYCHEDAHSREILADQINTGSSASTKEAGLVYAGLDQQTGSGLLAEKLKKALEKKSRL
jgi:hypothetical protein